MTFGQVASNGTEYLVVMLAAYYAFAILGMVRASVRACIRVPSFSVLCSPWPLCVSRHVLLCVRTRFAKIRC